MPCTAKPAAGEVVPMPMEPLVVKFPLLVVVALPPIVRMVEMYWFVLVALVVVAFQSERFVMVLEAWFTRMPPVNVARPVTESVPVAVRLAALKLPEKRPLPWTESACEGEVVPMPMFPEESIIILSIVPTVPTAAVLNEKYPIPDVESEMVPVEEATIEVALRYVLVAPTYPAALIVRRASPEVIAVSENTAPRDLRALIV